MCVCIYIKPTRRPRTVSVQPQGIIAVALFYPFSRVCEVGISLQSL